MNIQSIGLQYITDDCPKQAVNFDEMFVVIN